MNSVADGVPVLGDGDLSKLYMSLGGHDALRSGRLTIDPVDMAVYFASRPFLECHVRRRLQAIPNVTLLGGHDFVGLMTTSGRVTGARVVEHDGGAERELAADLVVDAMGRGAHTPGFLESLGYGRPDEEHIVMRTTYVSQRLHIPPGTLKEVLASISPVGGGPRECSSSATKTTHGRSRSTGCRATSRRATWRACSHSPVHYARHTCWMECGPANPSAR